MIEKDNKTELALKRYSLRTASFTKSKPKWHCDVVLPNITEEFTRLKVKRQPLRRRKCALTCGGVPAPSAGGDPEESDNDDKSEIEQPRGGNVFLAKWKSENAKTSFKNIVRAIIRASRWKIPLVSVKEEHSTEDLNKTWYEDQNTLHFNVNAFKAGSSGNAGLSKRARFILMKNAWERSEEELELIHSVVDQMKCFAKYTPMVRHELARVMHFETFEDGRVIIQEGHQGFSMYFIVTGSVMVQVSQVDNRTGERKNHVVSEIPAGSSFGELALIQEDKRSATIVCKGTSQFLRLDKPDFNMVLRRSCEQEWEDKMQMLRSLSFFSNWSKNGLSYINRNCRVVEFPIESIILGDTTETPEHMYFIVSGICKIVKQVTILETTSHLGTGQTMLSLPPDDALKAAQSKSKAISKRFLVIGQMEKGDYFGVGEDLSSTFIMASTKVDCLVVPRHTVVALERSSTLTGASDIRKVVTVREMLHHAESRFLSEENAFEKWMSNLRWKNYKRKMLNDILSRKPASLAMRNARISARKTRINCLSRKVSTLGYPLADSNRPPTPIYRRSGYQNTDQHVRLPPIKNAFEPPSPKQSRKNAPEFQRQTRARRSVVHPGSIKTTKTRPGASNTGKQFTLPRADQSRADDVTPSILKRGRSKLSNMLRFNV
nr:uncharacterized protein LOC101242145 [Ciona intestinalis]|eukprot:XP_004225769.1 uncharacterized protein LOC101242145 [Ciona intestinalis]